jgi:hypothetical protein
MHRPGTGNVNTLDGLANTGPFLMPLWNVFRTRDLPRAVISKGPGTMTVMVHMTYT